MLRISLVVLALLAVACALSLRAESPNPGAVSQETIDRLIKQLGSDNYEEREAAKEELFKAGEPARDALEEAAKSPDIEVSSAAKDVLKKLNMTSFAFRCTDLSGKPLAGKNVKVSIIERTQPPEGAPGLGPNMPQPPQQVEIKNIPEDGVVKMNPVDQNNEYEIQLSVDDYAAKRMSTRRFQGGILLIPAAFEKCAKIKGVAVDITMNKAPLAGVVVRTIGGDTAVTDNNGAFEMNVRPGAAWVLYDIQQRYIAWPPVPPFFLRPGETKEIAMEASPIMQLFGSFEGKILKPDGTPLANSDVEIALRVPVTPPLVYLFLFSERPLLSKTVTATTDANGVFNVKDVEGMTLRVALRSPGYKPADLGLVELKSGVTTSLKNPITLEEGASLGVRVVDSGGKPVPLAKVTAFPAENDTLRTAGYPVDPLLDPSAGASDDGKAVLKDMPDGKFVVVARSPGFAPARSAPVAVKRGADNPTVEVKLARIGSLTVKGLEKETLARVEDLSAEITAGYDPLLPPPVLKTSGVGSSRSEIYLDQLAPGKYEILLRAPGFKPLRLTREVIADKDSVETVALELIGRGALAGCIKPGKDSPIDAVGSVLLAPLGGGQPLVLRLDKKGCFRAEDLDIGFYHLVVRDGLDRLLAAYEVNVDGKGTANIDAVLPPLGGLSGRLLDAEGKPLAGEIICFARLAPGFGALEHLPAMFDGANEIFTDAEGKFSVAALPEGRYALGLDGWRAPLGFQSPPAFNRYDARAALWLADVTGGKDTNVELKKPETTTVSGKINNARAEMKIELLPPAGDLARSPRWPVAACLSADDGTFSLENVPPGKYTLFVTPQFKKYPTYPAAGAAMQIEVKKGEPLKDLAVEMPLSFQAAKGRLKDFAGGASALLVLGEKYLAAAGAASDGSFTLFLPPGRYKITRIDDAVLSSEARLKAEPLEIVVEQGKNLAAVEIP